MNGPKFGLLVVFLVPGIACLDAERQIPTSVLGDEHEVVAQDEPTEEQADTLDDRATPLDQAADSPADASETGSDISYDLPHDEILLPAELADGPVGETPDAEPSDSLGADELGHAEVQSDCSADDSGPFAPDDAPDDVSGSTEASSDGADSTGEMATSYDAPDLELGDTVAVDLWESSADLPNDNTTLDAADDATSVDTTTGACSGCGTGAIIGRTCAPNAKTVVPYAKVSLDTFDCSGAPVHYETQSDAKGNYALTNVPCGVRTLRVDKGPYSTSFQVFVVENSEVVLSSGIGCFSSTAASIAVITGDWDQIELTLAKLELKFDKVSGTTPSGTGDGPSASSPDAIKFLTDTAKLLSYDVLFINCSDTGVENMATAGAEISKNLKAFVAKGGSLYGSDYALPYLTGTWPGYILGGAWSCGGWSMYPGSVVDLDLAGFIGKSTVNIKYGLGPLTCVEGVGPDTHVFIDSSKPISGCSGTEMMMSFRPEPDGGKVIYTTFHNDELPATQTDVQTTLEYTVFAM